MNSIDVQQPGIPIIIIIHFNINIMTFYALMN